ncbi:MAG: UDP-N-acetylmuramate dehydrogenase [Spirochaetales bacterium]|nr:UDP-N-acetylmuramate dehydrogenase [Spirochaetales bacterium]
MANLRDIIKKINIDCPILFNEPMKNHTSFQIGGPAEVFIRPKNRKEIIAVVRFCREHTVPCFILGGGANILVSDNGIKGITVDCTSLCGIDVNGSTIVAEAGVMANDLATTAMRHNLSGAEFLSSMPGTVGGALWMNARCYDREIADICVSAEILTRNEELQIVHLKKSDFGYKSSPFQHADALILAASFTLSPGEKTSILEKMARHDEDRHKKGHFSFPSAGSVFKNNRNFGKTTGEIIDSLELKGYSIGDAQISEHHANIIVNRGNATAEDVWRLIAYIRKSVKRELGYLLENEIIFVGEFEEADE